jgi:hypothetical protein
LTERIFLEQEIRQHYSKHEKTSSPLERPFRNRVRNSRESHHETGLLDRKSKYLSVGSPSRTQFFIEHEPGVDFDGSKAKLNKDMETAATMLLPK